MKTNGESHRHNDRRGDLLYRVVRGLLNVTVWGGDLMGQEDVQSEGPAVYVSNHARALGPIAITCSLPIRLHPWIIGDMLVWEKAVAYLSMDFVEPRLHVGPPLANLLSRLICQASVRLLRGVQCIPVWQGADLLETYRQSLDYLERGRSLLIFPEDPKLPGDEQCQMSPFRPGFAHLGELHFESTGKCLKFVPAAVRANRRVVKLGASISFNPRIQRVEERARIVASLESRIRRMLLEMSLESWAGIPQPR